MALGAIQAALSKVRRIAGVYGKQRRLAAKPFYRGNPNIGYIARRGLDSKGVISFEHGFFFNRIAKSANSTVMMSLAKSFLGQELVSRRAKSAFLRPSQLSEAELAAFDGLFKFSVVRDPYSRVLSAYLNKIVRTGRHYGIPRQGEVPSFQEFCRYLDQGGLTRNVHWAPQTGLLLIAPERFDFFGKVENLNEDWATIVHRIAPGREVPPLTQHDTGVTNATSRQESYYDDETRTIVARLYRDDFLAFGYDV